MKFKSELEQFNSYARLIPDYLWNIYGFIDIKLSTEDLFFLTESLNTLFDKKYNVMNLKQKKRALLFVLIRYLDEGFDKLASFAINTLELDKSELFIAAAILGQEEILEEIENKYGSTQLKEMIKLKDYAVFRYAAYNGHLATLKWLKKQAHEELGAMIKAKDYGAFTDAAERGQISTLKWLKEQASEGLDLMIQADDYGAFVSAARRGQLSSLKWLKEEAPEQFDAMIKAQKYGAFIWAAKYGQLSSLEWLKEEAPEQLNAMIRAQNYGAFVWAAMDGQLSCLKWLKEQAPEELDLMIQADDYSGFKYAASEDRTDTVSWLLLHPICLAYVEMHDREYGALFTYPFVSEQLESIHSRAQKFRESHPNSVFDLNDTEEARRFFYILRNLIRRNDRSLDDEMRFLLEIPSVKALAHQAVTPNQSNELVRLALTTGNTEAADILLNIDAVRVLAEESNFYINEQQGRFNLRQLAQDRESSMTALSTGEQKRFKALIKEYNPMLKNMGLSKVMDALRENLSTRYEDKPATITVNGVVVELPVDWTAFQQLQLDKTSYQEALKAYYQHKDHSALRYLSKPNPWMHVNASYVYVNEEKTQRWSTFEEYQPMISMLWLAAIDEKQEPTDGMNMEGRLAHFIDELALIGRAHNWDNTREKTKNIEEEYDDLEGDRPSCFSGVKRRLFHSLIGHSLIQNVGLNEIKQEFRDFLRTYFKAQINEENHATIKKSLEEYYITLDEEDIRPLEALNIPEKEQEAFFTALGNKYGAQFTEEPSFLKYLRAQFKLAKEDPPCHLLKFIQLTQVDYYINQYQSTRVSDKGLFSTSSPSKDENNMESNLFKKN